MEATGVVRAVGKAVAGVEPGQAVICNVSRCFSNRINLPASRTVPLPEGVSFDDGASIMSVYNTAHYALVYLARIRKGDRVLIHAGAGGVGHAAISICHHVGAEIYATASKAKREIVHALGVKHVYDSRSTSWFKDIMAATNGKGVNVVLNSLAGVHQKLGMQALAPGGRFLEIGKVDIYNNNHMDLLPFCKNTSFHGIDMDRMAGEDPELVAEITKEVTEHFVQGHYHRLPLTIFPMQRLRDALELVKTGSHIGKVVMVNYDRDDDGVLRPLTVRAVGSAKAKTPGTVLVTGGTGGFGTILVKKAYDVEGARHFIIPSRKGETEQVKNVFR